jgi:hypothetical protein
VGNAIGKAAENYNKALGSIERNFLPKARKLNELAAINSDKTVVVIDSIDIAPRELIAPETRSADNGIVNGK